FTSLLPPPPPSPLFPYTTLFRSAAVPRRDLAPGPTRDAHGRVGHPEKVAGRRVERGGRTTARRDVHRVAGDDRRALDRSCGECRSEEHTSELQSRGHLVCRLLLE